MNTSWSWIWKSVVNYLNRLVSMFTQLGKHCVYWPICVSAVFPISFPPADIFFLCDTLGLFPARPRYSSTDADTFPHLLYQTLLPGRPRVNWCSIFLHLFPCLSNECVYICRNVPFPRISTPARPHRCAHSPHTPQYSFSSSVIH